MCLLIFTAIFSLVQANDIAFAVSSVAYSLVVRNKTPTIKSGDTLEIVAFVSGYGIPSKNKLNVFWSSAYVIDTNNPGTYTMGDYGPMGMDSTGVVMSFSNEMFSTSTLVPESIPDYALPMITGETSL